MSPAQHALIAWSHGIAGAAYLLLASGIALKRDRGIRGTALLVAAGFTAAWALAIIGSLFLRSPALAAVSVTADALSYAGWYAFLLLLLSRRSGAWTIQNARANWAVAAGVAVVVWGIGAQLLVVFEIDRFGDPARLAAFDVVAAAVLGLVLVEQVFRNVADESRWAITPLCLGLAAVFAFDLYTFAEGLLLNRVDLDVWSVRGLIRALALPAVLLSVTRTRGGRANIVLSREVVFRSTALAACGVYLLFMAAAGYYIRYFGGQWGRAFQVAFLFAAILLLLILTFSRSVRAKLRVSVSKHFFRYRYDYREEWLRFTHALSTQGVQGHVGDQVIKGLADMVESPGGGLWLHDPADGQFKLCARWNMPAAEGANEPASGDLVTFLTTRGWVINLEEFRFASDRYGGLRLPEWLSRIESAWLVVPLSIGPSIIGFVTLLTARTTIEVNWEVNDLLKTAGRQAAIFLAQVQATEALLEARKFDAFNRMSAFVVHDLKNIVAQLSLMLRNAERHHGNPQFQQDMLMTVDHSVNRMKQLMLQLRDGTTPITGTHRVDLAEVAGRVKHAKGTQQPMVELEVLENVAAHGHEDRLERVIGHLVQNGIDATSAHGKVWIKIGRDGTDAFVEVGDDGHGMTPEFVRERLFKPFQTTKQTGMGIGAYESQQYVRELGGRIVVESAPNAGTRVRLVLPIAESNANFAAPVERGVAA